MAGLGLAGAYILVPFRRLRRTVEFEKAVDQWIKLIRANPRLAIEDGETFQLVKEHVKEHLKPSGTRR